MLHLVLSALLVGFALFAFAVPVQEGQEATDAPPMPRPGVAHQRLTESCGVWDAVVEGLGPPSQGKETVKSICGGFWIETDFQGEVFGQPFFGKGLSGVDPVSGKYVGVWIDSSGSPLVLQQAGEFSKDGKTLVQVGDGLDMEGKPAKFRYTTTFVSKDERHFELAQVLPDGSVQVGMKIRYTRAK